MTPARYGFAHGVLGERSPRPREAVSFAGRVLVPALVRPDF